MTDEPRPFYVAEGDEYLEVLDLCRMQGAVRTNVNGDEEFYVSLPARPEPAWVKAITIELCLGTTRI